MTTAKRATREKYALARCIRALLIKDAGLVDTTNPVATDRNTLRGTLYELATRALLGTLSETCCIEPRLLTDGRQPSERFNPLLGAIWGVDLLRSRGAPTTQVTYVRPSPCSRRTNERCDHARQIYVCETRDLPAVASVIRQADPCSQRVPTVFSVGYIQYCYEAAMDDEDETGLGASLLRAFEDELANTFPKADLGSSLALLTQDAIRRGG